MCKKPVAVDVARRRRGLRKGVVGLINAVAMMHLTPLPRPVERCGTVVRKVTVPMHDGICVVYVKFRSEDAVLYEVSQGFWHLKPCVADALRTAQPGRPISGGLFGISECTGTIPVIDFEQVGADTFQWHGHAIEYIPVDSLGTAGCGEVTAT